MSNYSRKAIRQTVDSRCDAVEDASAHKQDLMRLGHKLWLRENLKAKPQYRYTVCVKGLLPTTWHPLHPLTGVGDCASQTNSNVMLLRLNTNWRVNTHICLHTGMNTHTYNTLDYVHGVGCIISCDQYIHDFSRLEIHLTVKARGCSRVHTHTLRFTVYIQRSLQSISDRWLKWSSCLSVTTDRRSSIHVCAPVCVSTSECVHVKQMCIMCFSHAYTYCTWHRIMITQVCVSEVNVNW